MWDFCDLRVAFHRAIFGAVVFILADVVLAMGSPIIIDGKTIPENRISRDAAEQVIALNLGGMGIDEGDLLLGIAPFVETIQAIDLSDNGLSKIDLSPLSEAINLYSIDLSKNDLKEIDLSPLAGLPRLSLIMISSNRLKGINLEPLASCPRLRILHLQDNRISDIDLSPLCRCDSLRSLWLYKNRLSELPVKPFSQMKGLREVRLYWNPFSRECLEKFDLFASKNRSIDFLYR